MKVVSIDGYEDVDETDSALLCATVQQPISVGMDGSALDFQLYTGVSISSLVYLELQIFVKKCCSLDWCDANRESMMVTVLMIRTTLIMLF